MTDCGDKTYRLGLIGAGVMGRALLASAIRENIVANREVIASDPSSACRAEVESMVCAATDDNGEVARNSETLLVAVKPQIIGEVLRDLRADLREGQLLISIAAGVSIAALREMVGDAPRIVRVMPNICCTVGASASAFAADGDVTCDQIEFVDALLSAAGEVVAVREELLDAVTGLSGSGPAFVAVFIEALTDGGVKAGLPREQAQKLAAQTALGAARWLLETDSGPADLKNLVTSPGGTTIAGLAALEERGLRAAAMSAVVAAAERSKELGE